MTKKITQEITQLLSTVSIQEWRCKCGNSHPYHHEMQAKCGCGRHMFIVSMTYPSSGCEQ